MDGRNAELFIGIEFHFLQDEFWRLYDIVNVPDMTELSVCNGLK